MLRSSIVVVFNRGVRNFGCKQENHKILNSGFEVNITTMEMMEDSESLLWWIEGGGGLDDTP